jgi:hypothetical protein
MCMSVIRYSWRRRIKLQYSSAAEAERRRPRSLRLNSVKRPPARLHRRVGQRTRSLELRRVASGCNLANGCANGIEAVICRPERDIKEMPLFRWEDVDHSLVSLKLTNLAEEMHHQTVADERRIQFENRGNLNSNTVPSLVLQMKQDRADEWARRVYEIYCDVWQTQGYVKSAAFVRAVYVRGIVPGLRARTGAIASEFAGFATRTSFPIEIGNAHLLSLRLNMQRLEDRWRRRLEIEAKQCEHAERTKNQRVISTSSPDSQDHSSIALHAGNQSPSVSKVPSQACFLPIRSSVPLSEFEATAGKLMVETRRGCPAKYLPQTEIFKIAALLDDKNLPVRSNLEREAARTMAEYNQRYPTRAIKSWRAALSLPQFRRAVRKRFSRAEEKYKKAAASVAPSAGTPRTTI